MTTQTTKRASEDARRRSGYRADQRALVDSIDSILQAMHVERSVAPTMVSRDLEADLVMALLLRRRGVLGALGLLARPTHDRPKMPREGGGRTELSAQTGMPPAVADSLLRSFGPTEGGTYPWSLPEVLQWLRDDVVASPLAAVQRMGREPGLVAALHATCAAVLACAIDMNRGEGGRAFPGQPTT